MLLDESSNSIIKAEEKQSAKSRLQITNSTNRKKSAPDYPDADFLLENLSNISTFSNDSNFFNTNSSSKVLLVEARGIEPLSENPSERFSTSVAGCYNSRPPPRTGA